MKLCCSIAPTSVREARKKLSMLRGKVDIVEIRIDGMRNMDFSKLLQRPRPEVIITNRIASEGGKFTGSADEQITLLSEAARHRAEYIDMEMRWGQAAIAALKSQCGNSQLIVSSHNFERTPDNLFAIYHKLHAADADIMKIAVMANDITDNQQMFSLYERAAKDRRPLIALCMGERGEISRILARRFGGFLTFGSYRNDAPTAPGQYSWMDLKYLFRAGNINRQTKLFGLIGNPVRHSKGIYFHNTIFQKKSLDAVYLNFLVDDPGSFMKTFRPMLQGCSVTMPFKETIVPFLDKIDGSAKELKTVNTVIRHKNNLRGYNTDLTAIIDLLKKRTTLKNKRMIILGTGGTSKVMIHAGVFHGAKVTVIGRTLRKARTVAEMFSCSAGTYPDLENMQCDILMNATPVGSLAHPLKTLLPRKFLKKNMIVFDAVYAPEITPLLLEAKKTGCTIVKGIELFDRQAEYQSKLFIESMR